MKTKNKSIAKDLMLLLDHSCKDSSRLSLFETFHKMIIRMSYKAVDVDIDYDNKNIHMNVLAEDESYDLVPINAFAEILSVNLSYTDMRTFLKSHIPEDGDILKLYYPFLMSSYKKSTTKISKVFET